MPYKSEAQRGFMHAAAERGDIKKSVVEDFDKASKGQKDLPEKVGKDDKKKSGGKGKYREWAKKR